MTLLNLNYFFIDTISKYSHIDGVRFNKGELIEEEDTVQSLGSHLVCWIIS